MASRKELREGAAKRATQEELLRERLEEIAEASGWVIGIGGASYQVLLRSLNEAAEMGGVDVEALLSDPVLMERFTEAGWSFGRSGGRPHREERRFSANPLAQWTSALIERGRLQPDERVSLLERVEDTLMGLEHAGLREELSLSWDELEALIEKEMIPSGVGWREWTGPIFKKLQEAREEDLKPGGRLDWIEEDMGLDFMLRPTQRTTDPVSLGAERPQIESRSTQRLLQMMDNPRSLRPKDYAAIREIVETLIVAEKTSDPFSGSGSKGQWQIASILNDRFGPFRPPDLTEDVWELILLQKAVALEEGVLMPLEALSTRQVKEMELQTRAAHHWAKAMHTAGWLAPGEESPRLARYSREQQRMSRVGEELAYQRPGELSFDPDTEPWRLPNSMVKPPAYMKDLRGSAIVEAWRRNVDPEFLKKLQFIHWSSHPGQVQETLKAQGGRILNDISGHAYLKGDPDAFTSTRFVSGPRAVGFLVEGDINFIGNFDAWTEPVFNPPESTEAGYSESMDPVFDPKPGEGWRRYVSADPLKWAGSTRFVTYSPTMPVLDEKTFITTEQKALLGGKVNLAPKVNEALIGNARVTAVVLPSRDIIAEWEGVLRKINESGDRGRTAADLEVELEHLRSVARSGHELAEELGVPALDLKGEKLPPPNEWLPKEPTMFRLARDISRALESVSAWVDDTRVAKAWDPVARKYSGLIHRASQGTPYLVDMAYALTGDVPAGFELEARRRWSFRKDVLPLVDALYEEGLIPHDSFREMKAIAKGDPPYSAEYEKRFKGIFNAKLYEGGYVDQAPTALGTDLGRAGMMRPQYWNVRDYINLRLEVIAYNPGLNMRETAATLLKGLLPSELDRQAPSYNPGEFEDDLARLIHEPETHPRPKTHPRPQWAGIPKGPRGVRLINSLGRVFEFPNRWSGPQGNLADELFDGIQDEFGRTRLKDQIPAHPNPLYRPEIRTLRGPIAGIHQDLFEVESRLRGAEVWVDEVVARTEKAPMSNLKGKPLFATPFLRIEEPLLRLLRDLPMVSQQASDTLAGNSPLFKLLLGDIPTKDRAAPLARRALGLADKYVDFLERTRGYLEQTEATGLIRRVRGEADAMATHYAKELPGTAVARRAPAELTPSPTRAPGGLEGVGGGWERIPPEAEPWLAEAKTRGAATRARDAILQKFPEMAHSPRVLQAVLEGDELMSAAHLARENGHLPSADFLADEAAKKFRSLERLARMKGGLRTAGRVLNVAMIPLIALDAWHIGTQIREEGVGATGRQIAEGAEQTGRALGRTLLNRPTESLLGLRDPGGEVRPGTLRAAEEREEFIERQTQELVETQGWTEEQAREQAGKMIGQLQAPGRTLSEEEKGELATEVPLTTLDPLPVSPLSGYQARMDRLLRATTTPSVVSPAQLRRDAARRALAPEEEETPTPRGRWEP